MKHEIRFKGLSLDRDELAAQHGELALCGGVELHDGALRPSELNGTPLGGGDALPGTLLYVHINASYKHYIYNTPSPPKLWWAEETVNDNVTSWTTHEIANFVPQENIVSINSVGNTLCVFTTGGIHYILFKGSGYVYLGQKPPFLELQFNMAKVTGHNTVATEVEFTSEEGGFISKNDADDYISADNPAGRAGKDIREGYQSTITEQVMASANKLINEASEQKLFHAPFFVRYCYRMYGNDSPFVYHSPAVLLMPVGFTGQNQPSEITAGVEEFYRSDTSSFSNTCKNFSSGFTCNITILTAKLQVKCLNTSAIASLQNWGDVIKSLDIFITPQISRIVPTSLISFIKYSFNGRLGRGLLDGIYDNYNAANVTRTEGSVQYGQGELQMPLCSTEEFKEKIKNTSTFFKLSSFKTETLQNVLSDSFSDLEIEENIVPNIVVQEQMVDDYQSHNTLLPIDAKTSGLYVYNHRLNVFGISEGLFPGFIPQVLFPYIDGTNYINRINEVIVTFSTEDGPKRVKKSCDAPFVMDAICDFVFFPDARANGIAFGYIDSNNEQQHYKFVLKEHLSLNGAFYAYGQVSYFNIPEERGGDNVVAMPNKIYTSRMDNPYYFPNIVGESGVNTVGNGTILGMGVLTRALSPGQTGTFDVAIFATDAIWIGKISSTGTYTNINNISNEVCINSKSIRQLGQSIICATNRALVRFVESDVIHISDALDGPVRNFETMMPDFYNLFKSGGAYQNTDLKNLLDFKNGAIDFFSKGSVFYDYESKRLLILPENVSTSTTIFVYSLQDQTWSTMMIPPLMTIIQGYPYPYYQLGNSSDRGKVFVMDKPYPQEIATGATSGKGIVITRTLVFSETMDVIQGFQQLCDCENTPLMYFYGSNDQRTWTLIGYSNRPYANYLPGHPYRYFRIAMYLTMAKTERYQELILDVTNKYAKL